MVEGREEKARRLLYSDSVVVGKTAGVPQSKGRYEDLALWTQSCRGADRSFQEVGEDGLFAKRLGWPDVLQADMCWAHDLRTLESSKCVI